jgi:hypothetical protein
VSTPERFANEHHLRNLFGTTSPTRPDTEALRRQLADCGESAAGMIAEAARAPSPDRLEQLSIQLQGISRLASNLRVALMQGGERDG